MEKACPLRMGAELACCLRMGAEMKVSLWQVFTQIANSKLWYLSNMLNGLFNDEIVSTGAGHNAVVARIGMAGLRGAT